MNGAPVSSVPTSSTRATCSLFQAHRRARLAQEALHHLVVGAGLEQLDGDPLLERLVQRGDDDAHAPCPRMRSTR